MWRIALGDHATAHRAARDEKVHIRGIGEETINSLPRFASGKVEMQVCSANAVRHTVVPTWRALTGSRFGGSPHA
jgi:hypothetical protein